jgi:hypothetical protein
MRTRPANRQEIRGALELYAPPDEPATVTLTTDAINECWSTLRAVRVFLGRDPSPQAERLRIRVEQTMQRLQPEGSAT